MDSSLYSGLRYFLTEAFKSKTRSEWEVIFDEKDACCLPVLEDHEYEGEGDEASNERMIPKPVPTLSRTSRKDVHTFYEEGKDFWLQPGKHTIEVLSELGLSEEEIGNLEAQQVIRTSENVKARI
jgi:alpha-methylacyl-CoA racemase